MSNNKGYIKLSRKFFENALWKEPREYSRAEAWLDLVQSARFESSNAILNGRVIEVQKGEIAASRRYLEQRWRWGSTKVNNFIDMLKINQMITTKQTSGQTIISLCNYSVYNDSRTNEQTVGKPPTNQTQTTGKPNISNYNKLKITNTPLSPNGDISPARGEGVSSENEGVRAALNSGQEEKRKKVAAKKEKVFNLMFVDPKWQQLMLDWLTYRKEMGKPYRVQRSIELFYDQLREYSREDGKMARKIINRAIANGWQGIFRLTDDGKTTQNGRRTNATNDEELMQDIASGCKRGLSELQRKGE